MILKTSPNTSRKTSHRPPIDLPSCRPDFRLILLPFAHFKSIRILFHRTFICELTPSPTGGLTGGLWEVLREVLGEVFQAFPFYNSLILRSLRKSTGGLGKKIENWRLKIENSQSTFIVLPKSINKLVELSWDIYECSTVNGQCSMFNGQWQKARSALLTQDTPLIELFITLCFFLLSLKTWYL